MKYKHGVACKCGCETFHVVIANGIVEAICTKCEKPYNGPDKVWRVDDGNDSDNGSDDDESE